MSDYNQAIVDAIKLRYYQDDAVTKTCGLVLQGKHPIVALPTGSGKSIVLCGIAERIIDEDPTANVLILSHVKEILEQNHAALENYFGIEIGLFSAGLDSKTVRKITVAGIQSALNSIEEFAYFDYVLIDEAHRVSFEQSTGYRRFIKELEPKSVIGLTATPYRTKGGYIYEGDDALFDCIAVDYTQHEEFLGLIEEGFLVEIFSKKTKLKMYDANTPNADVKAKTTGGDFNVKDLSEQFNRDAITHAAVLESIHFGKKYKHWLCFAIDIEHAENIKRYFEEEGISACVVHSKMEESRDSVIADFKRGKYRVLINVDILTTGFDFPAIDLVLMMRPTKSPIIHVQTIGRALRPVYAKGYNLDTKQGRLDAIENGGKPHALVLDFAGNTKRLGPINDIKIKQKGDKKGSKDAITKDCPECDFINHGAARECVNCGHEFKIKEKLTMEAAKEEVIKKKEKEEKKYLKPEWIRVDKVEYELCESKKAGQFVKVTYHSGISTFSEVVCPEAKGYPKHLANHWIKFRTMNGCERARTASDLIRFKENLLTPTQILVDRNGKYDRIQNAKFN